MFTSCVMQATDSHRIRDLITALYTVVRNAYRLRQTRVRSACDKSGYVLLGMLRELGPLRLSELAAAVHLDVSTVSRQVQPLITGGFCDVLDDPEDRRARRLRITPAGEAELDAVVHQLADALTRAVRDWSQRDVDTLAVLLHRLGTDLGAVLAADGPVGGRSPHPPAEPPPPATAHLATTPRPAKEIR